MSPLALAIAGLFAGAFNGVLQVSVVALFNASPHGVSASVLVPTFTALVGAAFALPFVPALAAIASCAARRRLVRDGSLVDRAYLRALWSVTALSVAIGCVLLLPAFGWQRPLVMVVALSACATVLLLAGADVDALRKLNSISRTMGECRDWVLSDRELEGATDSGLLTDFGVGQRVVARVRSVAHAYRQVERPEAFCRGDIVLTQRALRGFVARAVTMGVVATILGVLQAVELLGQPS